MGVYSAVFVFCALSMPFLAGEGFGQTPEIASSSQLNEPWDWNPDVSPDGRYIVFEREDHIRVDADIFIWDTESRSVRTLVDTDGYDRFPIWSPDGEWIYYSHVETDDPNWHWQMYRVSVDGAVTEHILPSDQSQLLPQPSPDNEWIMYVSRDPEDPATLQHIHISHIDGSDHRVITRDVEALAQHEHNYNWFFHPDWSPDGSSIVFMAGNMDDFEIDIWTMDVSSGEAAPLFAAPGTNQLRPSYSPDGDWIAFGNGQGRYDLYQLIVMRTDRTAAYGLDASMEWHSRPSWTPEGDALVFHEIIHSGAVIARYDLETGITTHFGIPGGYEEEWRRRLPDFGEVE